MRSLFSRSLCILLAAACCTFTGCRNAKETGAGYLFTSVLSGNPACLDPQFSDNPNAAAVIPCIMEGLVRLDEDGMPVLAGAESYTVTEDGLYYMFNLRTNCYWYNCEFSSEEAFPVTAQDYVFAFQRLFDSETDSPYAKDFSCLKNGIPILTGVMDCTEIGVSAPDDYTVLFQLDTPNAEFLQLLAQPCAMPCNEAFFYSTNGRYGLSPKLILCNGPFVLTQWSYDPYGSDNLMYFKKNGTYYDAENISPSQLNFTICKTESDAVSNFVVGSADVILTDRYQSQYMNSKQYTAVAKQNQTLGLIFNPQNEILQNENLRLALAYGINRSSLSSVISEDLQTAHGIIPPAVQVLGCSYREVCADETLALPYDGTKAAELFREASEELQLHAMNTIQILVPSTITDTDALLTICQEWQNLFDYYIGIETVSPDEYHKRIANGDYSIALYSISGERNSCSAVLDTFLQNASFFGLDSEAFTSAMAESREYTLLSDAVSLYYAAEASIIESGIFIPLFYKNSYLIYTSDNTDIYFDPFAGTIDFRLAKHFSD